MDATRQQLVRDLLDARRSLIAAEMAWNEARAKYIELETRYVEQMPSIPGRVPNVFCGDVFIVRDYGENQPGLKLDFTEGERCPTSE